MDNAQVCAIGIKLVANSVLYQAFKRHYSKGGSSKIELACFVWKLETSIHLWVGLLYRIDLYQDILQTTD